jgi:ribosomal protein L7Ae-like RNA K-turn-binding protein
MLGLARKGGNVSIGFDAACLDIKDGKTALALIASDASEKTKSNIIFVCDRYGCRYIEYGEKEGLGRSLGKKVVSVLSINDKNIASYILNNL